METATVDGITSTSASESAEQIVASLSHQDESPTPTESAATPEPKSAPAKRSSYQARIDELTAQLANKTQADTAINEKLAKIDALERKLAALESPRHVERPAPQAQPPVYSRPKPSEDEVGEKYEKYADYIEDLTDWKAEQREFKAEQERVQSSRQSAEAQRHQTFAERLEAAKTTIPNFDAVLASEVRLSRPMQDAIKDSEIGPQLMAHLHEHQDEAERIYRAGSPLQVFKEMNKLEARLEAAVDRGPAPKAKPVSQAKPPIKPLGAAHSAVSDGPPGDDASYEEHERYWNAKEAAQMRQGR